MRHILFCDPRAVASEACGGTDMQIIVARHDGSHVACLQNHTKRLEIGGHGAMATGERVGNRFSFCWHEGFYASQHRIGISCYRECTVLLNSDRYSKACEPSPLYPLALF